MKSSLRHIAVVLATALCSLQSADAQLVEPPDRVGWQPRSFACAETSPALVFTKQDFEKGFDRFYKFPNVTECDGYTAGISDYRQRSGSLRLTYNPSAPNPMTAEVRYREQYACDEGKGMAVHSFEWYGYLQPVDKDPKGIFPAAGFEAAAEKPAKFSYHPCFDPGEGGPSTPWIDVYLGLVYQDDATGELVRKPFIGLDGGPSGAGQITFGPVLGPPDSEESLAIEGCADIDSRGAAVLVAKANPPGGQYTWSSNPTSILELDGTGTEVYAVATAPGRTTIRLDYDPPDGKRVSATLPGSVVNLQSVNNGTPLEVGVYDFAGRAGGAPARAFPTAQQPPDPSLLRFEAEDPGLVTVVNQGDGVMVQGQGREGSTTAQAQAQCGAYTGPVFTINVVPCDEETRAKVDDYNQQMRKSEQEIVDGLRQAVERSKSLRNDPNYRDALDSIKGNAINTATSIAEALLLAESYGGSISHAGHKLERVLTAYNVGRSAIKGTIFNDQIQEALALMGVLPVANIVAALIEVGIYANKFADNAARIADTEDQLAELVKQTDFDVKRLYQMYQNHKRFCDKDADGSKAPPSQPPSKRRDGPQGPSTPSQGSGGSPGGSTEPGGPGEGAGSGEGEPGEPGETISPPPPVTPPKPPTTGGFILADCGCESFRSSAWGTDVGGLQAIGADMRKTEACGTGFRTSLQSIQTELTGLGTLPERLSSIATLPDDQAAPLLEDAVKEINRGVSTLEAFRQDAAGAKSSLETCGDQPRQAGELVDRGGLNFEADTTEVIDEADRITVESLRTHY